MATVLRISEAASLGLHAMSLLAEAGEGWTSAGGLAETLGVSEAHLAKVLQHLGRVGLVKSVRGPRGGFSLARPGSEITLLEIYEALEGPMAETHCLLGRQVCHGSCLLGGLLKTVDELVRAQLSSTTLAPTLVGKVKGKRSKAKASIA
jgi:Rrf2 family protein